MKDCFYPHCASWELRHTVISTKYGDFSKYASYYTTQMERLGTSGKLTLGLLVRYPENKKLAI